MTSTIISKAIAAYRETEKLQWNAHNTPIIERIRQFVFPGSLVTLEHVHVLDLAKQGEIRAHVDSVKFCGRIIGGLSLLSDCVMRLAHERQPELIVDVMLRRRSLYIMQDVSRFDFTHAVLAQNDSLFATQRVPRERRISIIFRCKPEETTATTAPENGRDHNDADNADNARYK